MDLLQYHPSWLFDIGATFPRIIRRRRWLLHPSYYSAAVVGTPFPRGVWAVRVPFPHGVVAVGFPFFSRVA